jgi:hypothetical protein
MDQSLRYTKHKAFIHYLAVAYPVQLKNLLQSASEAELTTVWEILVNFLAGNIKSDLDFSQRTDFLKTLASKSVNIQRKRIILDRSRVYRSVLQRLINSLI